jgi:diguanylate cyclase (GGDEF)-like protein
MRARTLDRWPLAAQMGAAVAVLWLLLLAITLWSAERVLSDALRASIGAQLEGVAADVAGRFDRAVAERVRDVRTVAALDPAGRPEAEADAARRALIETMWAGSDSFAWVGLADASGVVRIGPGGMREGEDVRARDWFREGLRGLRVAEAEGGDGVLRPRAPGTAPGRWLEISAPVRGRDGAPVGVVGARVDWGWTRDLRDAAIEAAGRGRDIRVSLADASGRVVVGDGAGLDRSADPSVKAALAGRPGWTIEPDARGAPMLAGFAPTRGHRDFAGFGWVAVARWPAEAALAPVAALRTALLGLGLLLGVLGAVVAMLVARRLARPIEDVTAAADRIGRSEDVRTLPRLSGSREVVELSRALRDLVVRVGAYSARLADAERTTVRLADEKARLHRLAAADPLTGCLNRRGFEELADVALEAARREGLPMTVLTLDVDHFKRINDAHGHAAGDEVLRAVAEAARAAVRESDPVARFGGEEFVMLLQGADTGQAIACAERLRRRLEATVVRCGAAEIRLTASVGCAPVDLGEEHAVLRAVGRADAALYAAKRNGRNRVEQAA